MSAPTFHRTRADLCPEQGHPPVTYNPLQDRTWCLCGARIEEGNAIPDGPHVACCGGSLTEEVPA